VHFNHCRIIHMAHHISPSSRLKLFGFRNYPCFTVFGRPGLSAGPGIFLPGCDTIPPQFNLPPRRRADSNRHFNPISQLNICYLLQVTLDPNQPKMATFAEVFFDCRQCTEPVALIIATPTKIGHAQERLWCRPKARDTQIKSRRWTNLRSGINELSQAQGG